MFDDDHSSDWSNTHGPVGRDCATLAPWLFRLESFQLSSFTRSYNNHENDDVLYCANYNDSTRHWTSPESINGYMLHELGVSKAERWHVRTGFGLYIPQGGSIFTLILREKATRSPNEDYYQKTDWTIVLSLARNGTYGFSQPMQPKIQSIVQVPIIHTLSS